MSDVRDLDEVCWVVRPAPRPLPDKLEHALRSDAIEFWCQPKIDLKNKRLNGVEVFARFRMPDGRIVSAEEMVAGASSASIVELTERALVSALKTSVNLCEIGVDIRLAINVSVRSLNKLPIAEIVRKHRPQGGKSLNLVFDISERQVLQQVDEIVEIAGQLRRCGFSVAVDDFGASVLSALDNKGAWGAGIDRIFETMTKLRDIEFSELKLARTLVRDCGSDMARRTICKHIIDLAHSMGSLAVAVGIEHQQELKTLRDFGCDIGQGYLFGRPMSEEDFLMLLWNRGVRARGKSQAD